MTRLLARLYWQQFKRTVSSMRTGQIIPLIAIGVFAVILVPIILFGGSALGSVMPAEDRTNFYSIITFGGMIITVLFTIPQVFKNLFSSKDVEMLFTLPIATKHIYWVKFGQSFFSTAAFVWVFLVLFFLSYGLGASVAWIYFFIVPIISLTVVLVGLSIAYLFNLLLIQIIPKSRVKELMTLMTGMAGLIIFLLVQIPNLMGIDNMVEGMSAELPALTLLPTHWAAMALSFFSQGYILRGLLWMAAMVIAVSIITLLTQVVVDRGFRTGWIRMSEGARRKKRKKRKKGKFHLLRSPVISIGLKELRAVQRDPREWLTFLPVLIIMVVPLFPILTNEGALESIIENTMTSWLVAHGLLIFFLTMLMGNFSASSIGREEKAVWILRTLPLSGMQIALGKLWVHWLIPLIFVLLIEIGLTIFIGWEWYMGIAGFIAFGFIALGMSGIGLWAGTIGGKYNPNNPQQRIETGTGFLLMLINIPYMLLMFMVAIFLFFPVEFQPYISQFSEGAFGLVGLMASLINLMISAKILLGSLSLGVGVLMLVIVSVGVTYLFLWLSAKRIDQGIQINIVDGTRTSSKGL
ncbi:MULTISPECIES: putative ABC transporter permease subunit [Bacillaceae]|uniref:ABC transporter permease n=1 Tax=Evansella alkalicola TaxID=745819 RepID=A0ABS6JRN3_9BACI|nr:MULTISPECIES: hypothetical protein [Bacillaceae]MBU9720374.1 hypothetical protein [Bacillus alkalicola]